MFPFDCVGMTQQELVDSEIEDLAFLLGDGTWCFYEVPGEEEE